MDCKLHECRAVQRVTIQFHVCRVLTLPHSLLKRKRKKKQPTLEVFWSKGEVKVGGKETAQRVLSYKNQQLILRVFSEIFLQLSWSEVKLQLKVVSEVLPPPFCQQLHSACPVMIQFKNLNQNYTSFLLGEDLEPPFWQQQ